MAGDARKLDYEARGPQLEARRDWITIALHLAMCGMMALGGAYVIYMILSSLWDQVPPWLRL